MKGRKPRGDELALWKKVADSVRPKSTPAQFPIEPQNSQKPKAEPAPDPLPPFKLPEMSGGKTALRDNIAPSLPDHIAAQPIQMDRKAFKKLQRGKLTPDAKLDLHGMTLDRAHGRLISFVMSSHASGKRLLLVITGKGKHRDDGGPIPVRYGVLRHQVPQWLRLAPLSSVVMQVTQAHQSHGGSGAYYVYLRRAR